MKEEFALQVVMYRQILSTFILFDVDIRILSYWRSKTFVDLHTIGNHCTKYEPPPTKK